MGDEEIPEVYRSKWRNVAMSQELPRHVPSISEMLPDPVKCAPGHAAACCCCRAAAASAAAWAAAAMQCLCTAPNAPRCQPRCCLLTPAPGPPL
jgi:hypothetical protein